MNKITIGMVITMLLVGCSNSPQEPVIRANPDDQGGITTMQVSFKSTSKMINGPGSGMQSITPPNTKLAYRFHNGRIQYRMDMPATMFPDGKARILLSDAQGANPRFYLQDTGGLDYSIPPEATQGLSNMAFTADLGMFNPRKPFQKLTTDQFITMAKKAAFDVAQNTSRQTIVARTTTTGQSKTTLTLYFDEQVGAVTQTQTQYVSPEQAYQASTNIKYTEVQGIENTTVPYQINTTLSSELQGALQQPQLEMPTATTTSTNSEIVLKDNEYVAAEFTSTVGEGNVNPNHFESTQVVEYQDIQINQLDESHFQLGQ